MIGLGSNRLTVCRRGGMSVTQAGRGGMEWLAGGRVPSWATPYSAQATAALLAQFPTQWPTIRDYGFAHPEIVGYMNAYAQEDAKIAYSLVEGIGWRYVVGNGTPYIEANCYPNSNWHVKSFLICRDSSNFAPYGIIGGWKYGWNGNIYSNYNNDVRITQTISSGGYKDKAMYVEQNKNLAYLDGELVKEHTYSQWTLTQKLVLFRNHSHRPKFDIANFVVKEGEQTLHWFVPFVRNEECGMMEMVTNTFYGNIAGSGSFTISESPS